MSAKAPQKLAELLQSGDISKLGAEARARRILAAQVRAELPADEATHVVSARIDEQGRLVVGVDSAAWAAKLRYSAETLLGHPVKVRVSVPRGSEP
ncbi:MAG: DciA family protein [Gammaproteobacteria bacterium]|nr:DciA family protein [Gammaproteobacteria bacterium]